MSMLLLKLLVVTFFCVKVAAQSDGNPHNWDRRRRCDHTDYTPKCGPCEGYGGIPYGDKNEEITLTTCEPVSEKIDPKTLVQPAWGTRFSTKTNEVLIGKKTDPFCFNAFPGNDSVGSLCYRPDSGLQTYDMEEARAIREDLTVGTKVGNVTSMIIHKGINMWIVNKLPWYALGTHQCICTEIHQGSDQSKPGMYPVQFNWTTQLSFIARERIGVEYGVGIRVLDHWAFGPHHVLSIPGTSVIIRMYQPFNGLQVFENGNNNTHIDPTLFDEIPPALCKKKGGATFRIKCDDNGFPKKKGLQDSQLEASDQLFNGVALAKPNSQDILRAHNKFPRGSYKGDDFREMSNTLNNWMKRLPVETKECSDFDVEEIQKLQALLYLARNKKFDQIYQDSTDNRRLKTEIEDLEESWRELNMLIDEHPDAGVSAKLYSILRDGHCHEAAMWYVHHLTQEMKELLGTYGDITIPLLSYEHHGESCAKNGEPSIAHDNDLKLSNAWEKVCSSYEEKVTCSSCHSNAHPPMPKF